MDQEMNLLCVPEMLDSLTVVSSFLVNPSPLRQTCQFMVKSYAHSIYLETTQQVPYFRYPPLINGKEDHDDEHGESKVSEERREFPVTMNNVYNLSSANLVVEPKLDLRPAHLSVADPPTPIQLCLVDLHCLRGIGGRILCEKPDAFMGGRMIHVVLARLPMLKSIGRNSMDNRRDVSSLEFFDLPELESIGIGWGCRTSITEVKVCSLPKLKTIGDNFMTSSSELRSATIQDLPLLSSVGNHFFSYCQKLTKFSLVGLPNLDTVEYCFLHHCDSLEEVTIESLPELTKICWGCLQDADALRTLTMKNLPKLKEVGERLAANSPNLQMVTFANLPSLEWQNGAATWFKRCDLAVVTFLLTDVPLAMSATSTRWVPKKSAQ